MTHDEVAGVEVDVLPAQPEQLALSQAGPERGDVQRLEAIATDAVEEGARLVAAERAAIAALLAAGPADGGTLDPEDARLGAAWARAWRGERLLWLSTAAVMAFVDAKAPDGRPIYPDGIEAPISALRPVYVPMLDATPADAIVGPARGFAWAEDTYTLQVDVPARAGRDVGLVGMLWYAPLAGLFTTYTSES